MKLGIVFLIYWAICFVIIYLYHMLTTSPFQKQSGQKSNVFTIIISDLVVAGIIAGIIILFSSQLNVKEGFFFTVSPGKEKCMKEQVSLEPSGFDRTCGCCAKDTRGVGSCEPFPMTPGNWPYRADEFSSDFKAAVPPIDSCECEDSGYDAVNKGLLGTAEGTESHFEQSPENGPDEPATGGAVDPFGQKEKFDTKKSIIEGYTTDELHNSIKNADINMYVLENCPSCTKTKDMLQTAGLEPFIKINNAKENLQMLKDAGVKGVPHFSTSSNVTHTGGIKSVEDFIEKLDIKLEKTAKENFEKVPEPKKSTTNNPNSNIQYSSRGKIAEESVNQYIENFVPNYQANNYQSKPSYYTGYYSYEQFLPDSVKYGSLAGQFTPPAPCGVSQNGLRAQ